MHPMVVSLLPDSCICQNCFRDYYRNPTKPWWYRKHEEFIDENGEQLEVGAELDIHSEPEGACEGQGTEDTTENDDYEDSDVMENERDGGIDKQQIKSVIDHKLLRLREEGCVYSKVLTHDYNSGSKSHSTAELHKHQRIQILFYKPKTRQTNI